jgi:hypothetical protein
MAQRLTERYGDRLAGCCPTTTAVHAEIIAALNKGRAHAVLIAEFSSRFTVQLRLLNPSCYYDDEKAY